MRAETEKRIGFVSTRLAGLDGVSLEVRKWADVLHRLGHECFAFAGEVDWQADRSYVAPEAHFRHPAVRGLSNELFGAHLRSDETTERVQGLKDLLKGHLRQFIRAFSLDLLIVENALAIPMNVPLGLAVTEVIAESGIPTIAHHHDFVWERSRFWPNAAGDYLRSAFPPVLPSVHHVVINSIARAELARRTGAGAMLIPNVMDFDSTTAGSESCEERLLDEFRATLGIRAGDRLVLQPTRIVPRKGIERSIELIRQLEERCTLVISHPSGDEGESYEEYLRHYADIMGVQVVFGSGAVARRPGETPDGRRIFSLSEVYRDADLVTYPSTIEGFGNAFLEAVYYRRPIVVNRYDVFKADIEPKGFKVVAFDGFIDEDTVERVDAVLHESSLRSRMVEHNFKLGRRHYSYGALETCLSSLLEDCARGASWGAT